MIESNTACFIGHKEIKESEKIRKKLYNLIENLIIEEKIDTFLFGSKSKFNSLCYEIVSDLMKKHPDIKRIYVRAEYPYIGQDYKKYLLGLYEKTYYPESILGSGRAIYVKRNHEMIDKSRICIFYYDKTSAPKTRKSGTEIAIKYALKKEKHIINLKD